MNRSRHCADSVISPFEIPAEIPGDISGRSSISRQLPKNRRTLEERETLQEIGSQWLRDAKCCVLAVPSAVIPAERNLLLNPAHPDFSRINIGQPEILESDLQLIRNLSTSKSIR